MRRPAGTETRLSVWLAVHSVCSDSIFSQQVRGSFKYFLLAPFFTLEPILCRCYCDLSSGTRPRPVSSCFPKLTYKRCVFTLNSPAAPLLAFPFLVFHFHSFATGRRLRLPKTWPYPECSSTIIHPCIPPSTNKKHLSTAGNHPFDTVLKKYPPCYWDMGPLWVSCAVWLHRKPFGSCKVEASLDLDLLRCIT